MRDEILLSIIIPVYNVEKYLNECVDSVLMQLTEECEIILVDDGSTDSSGDICQWYALNNSQVRVVRKDNGGLSSARNSGMKIAKGKYISFVDSDDVIFSGSIAEILNWIKSKGTDMCFMRAVKFYPDGTQIDLGEQIVRSELESKSKEDAVKYLASRPKYPGSAWAKLYRREFLMEYDLHFPYDRRYSEDLGFIRDCILNAHDFDALEKAFENAKNTKGQPTAIVMSTVKGKGVSFMENDAGWHGKAPNDAEYEQAMSELKAQLAEVEGK